MFGWLKKVTFIEDSEVYKMGKLLNNFENSKFGTNYLVEISDNGGDFTYSSLIFFDISNDDITNEEIISNSPVKIKEIDYYTFSKSRKVSIRRSEYYNENIKKIEEYNALLYTFIEKYKDLPYNNKETIAMDYRETLEKLYQFIEGTRVYLISNEDYDLIKVTLALILDNIDRDMSIDKNAIREELKMEVKYLNTIREKQIEMKEFERGIK